MKKEINKKVGLFFGSFNPITIGHLIVANNVIENIELDEIWFVVSPLNPHKSESGLEDEYDRLAMVRLAISDEPRFNSCSVEFNLPKPSYTCETLRLLRASNPSTSFSIIAGSDTQRRISGWMDYEEILQHHNIIVYPRVLTDEDKKWELTPEIELKSIYLEDVLSINFSATYVREQIKNNKSIKYLVPNSVIEYIDKYSLFANPLF